MKIHRPHTRRTPNPQSGSAVIVILVFLSIMVLLVAANTRTLGWLRTEVRLVDQQQTARLAAGAAHPVTGAISTPAPTP
jgi:hypothetical protein